MKKLVPLALSTCLLSLSQVFGAVLSSTNGGIYLAIAGAFTTNEPIRFDDKLVWRPFSTTGTVQLNYGDPEYGMKVNMTGPDGKIVPKSAKGQTFGYYFDKVQRYEDAVHGWHMGSIDAQGAYDARDGALSGALLPAPKDLFNMKEPGIYALEVQIQVFRVNKGTNGWSRDLIRFAPVTLKVEKPIE